MEVVSQTEAVPCRSVLVHRHILQFEARLGGARAVGKQPVVHRIVVDNSIEQRVAQARIVKGATMRDLMGAMKRRG
jgi:hypothetical protein